jgi:hypothetical protein
MKCPCNGCDKRWVTNTDRCDSTCKDFKEWKSSYGERIKFKKESKKIRILVDAVRFRRKR